MDLKKDSCVDGCGRGGVEEAMLAVFCRVADAVLLFVVAEVADLSELSTTVLMFC